MILLLGSQNAAVEHGYRKPSISIYSIKKNLGGEAMPKMKTPKVQALVCMAVKVQIY